MKTFTVTISNSFDAESSVDAVEQMVEWLTMHGGAVHGGYRVEGDDGSSVFLDAERDL